MTDLYERANALINDLHNADHYIPQDRAIESLQRMAPDLARAYIAQHEAQAKDDARVKALVEAATELGNACERMSAAIDDPMGRPGSARVAMLLAAEDLRAALAAVEEGDE